MSRMALFMSRMTLWLSALILIGGTVLARASESTTHVDTPSQPLAISLRQLADQTGLQLAAVSSAVQGKNAPAVKGDFSTQNILDMLLKDSGLSYKFLDSRTIAISSIQRTSRLERTASSADILLAQSDQNSEKSQSQNKTTDSSAKADEVSSLDQIVVTAQKRSESVDKVGMSINAVSGDALSNRGVADVADLVKVIPSFTYTPTLFATPVYIIRGVGLNDSGYASSPAVSVYVDQVALPYPVMTQGATLDLERVEVLKGPQGTLFGENSTGGAINYIGAKPTSEFATGGDFSIARFNKTTVDGYVSGPLTDTLNARVAVRTVNGGAYQESLTRPRDYRGNNQQLYGRLLLDFRPMDKFTVAVNLNAWNDQSETLAPQLAAIIVKPKSYPSLLSSPTAPRDPTYADWLASYPTRKNDKFYQLTSREDYELTDILTLTAITAYQHADLYRPVSYSGSGAPVLDNTNFGSLENFNQELRLAADADAYSWLVGANFDHTVSDENSALIAAEYSANQPVPFIGPFTAASGYSQQRITTKAAFANLQYKLTDALSAQGGVRYTDVAHSAANCEYDPTTAQNFTTLLNFLEGVFQATPGSPSKTIPPYGCFSLNPQQNFTPQGVYYQQLPEHNVSWRFGLNYTLGNGALLYVNDSRGYKSGIIPNIAATSVQQYAPAKQERLDAYEAGVKLPLAQRRVEVTGATYFYKYADKQVRASIVDPVFGAEETTLTVPKSEVWGAETGISARPIPELTVSLNAAYTHAAVSGAGFVQPIVNLAGQLSHFGGSTLPYTPKVTGNVDLQYSKPVSFRGASLVALLGASGNYQSSEEATYQIVGAKNAAYTIPSYALLDLRAGLGTENGTWKVLFWGRNVTNKFYITAVNQSSDTRMRYVGEPRTYGITVSYRR
jgi:iron complex outermembrane recepter protein